MCDSQIKSFLINWDVTKITSWNAFDNAASEIHLLFEYANKDEIDLLVQCLKDLNRHSETINEPIPEEEEETPGYFSEPWD